MVSKMKFKDWTCDSCRDEQKTDQRAQQASSNSNANDDAGAAPATAATTTPKRRGWHTCKQCHLERQHKDFRVYDKGQNASRCRDCEYPTCAACGKRSQKQVEPPSQELQAYESATFPGQRTRWYCDNPRCQTQSPCKCDLCLQYRECDMFRRKASRNALTTCAACQYPTCHICAFQHPASAKAILKNGRSRLGLQWYCTKAPCQEALRCAVREQKKTKTETDLTTAKPKTGPRGKK